MVQRVDSKEDAAALAARILTLRTRPLVVVSTDPATGRAAIDVDELRDQVGDVADFVLITTGDVSWELDQLLPEKTQVFGGAGRSYPVDFASAPTPERSRLRFPGKRAAANLIGDVLTHANEAGLFAAKPAASRIRVDGTVRGFAAEGSRAIVDLDRHGLATVSRELTFPPFPLDWTLHIGQRVAGEFDLDTRRLILAELHPGLDDLATAFPHHSVTFAFVRKVTPGRAWLQLHPRHERIVRLGDVSPNPLDTVDLLLAEGDVVMVRVIDLSTGDLHLSLVDVEDDEPVLPALALTPGGSPWLDEGRVLNAEPTDAADELAEFERLSVAAALDPGLALVSSDAEPGVDMTAQSATVLDARRPLPGPGMRTAVVAAGVATALAPITVDESPSGSRPALRSVQLQLTTARARIEDLERRLADIGADDWSIQKLKARASGAESRLREELAERGALERELGELKEYKRSSTRALREARKSSTSVSPSSIDDRGHRRVLWASDEEWLRHEIYLAWVDRVAPCDRTQWHLGEYTIGFAFAESIAALNDGQFAKAMKAVVDALTGRIREIPGREVHALRSGDGAGDPDLVRPSDGAKCMRAYIEQNTPAARRLHYWMVPGGGVELSRVVTHDDVEP